VTGLSVAGILAVGLPVLALHLFAIALTKALRSYSPSLLEERCREQARSERAEEVARLDQRTERSAETLAVLTGLLLSALVGMGICQFGTPRRVEWMLLLVLAIGLLGYVLAGVIGKVFAESIIDATWPASGLIRALAIPLTFGLRQVEWLVEWAAGRLEAPQRPASVEVEIPSEEEISEDDEPELPESARELLQHAVELTRTDVSEIMTPRPLIVSLPATVSAEAAAATFRQTGLSRIPIFGANHDDIVGILYVKDLFARMTEVKSLSAVNPRKLLRPAYFAPETKNAFELLEELRTQRRQIAIVLDEYGGVAGLVTLEDMLEELVGTIDDEHDIPTPDDPIRELGESRYEVDATLPVEALNERLGLHLPTDAEYLTVGGLAFHALGRVPEPGDSFNVDGVLFKVVEVADHRIRRVLVDLQGAASVRTAS
jgi:CBS domain containing-hemolysin-like protein